MIVPIPIQLDESGYIDKECPSETCLFQFKVYADDWKNLFKDESVFCPLCGNDAPAKSFWTTEQIEQAKKQAINIAIGKISQSFSDMASEFNRNQPKNGFISLKMEYKPTHTNSIIIPISAKKELEQKIVCKNCGARYSVLGSAFFCPCCGHNSVTETFDNSLKKIESKIKNLETIRKAVSEINADEAELTVRSLIESGLTDGVVAFQRFCELTYKNYTRSDAKIKQNAFQNLEIGGQHWKDLFSETYEDWIAKDKMMELKILFQKRHLLAHSEGIVDEKYIQNSNDNTYKVGQRIVVKEKDVMELVGLIKKISNIIKQKCEEK